MRTTVTTKNRVSIPARLAAAYGIKPGTRLEWIDTDEPAQLLVRILPDRATALSSLKGAGRKYLRPGQDPIANLLRDREQGIS